MKMIIKHLRDPSASIYSKGASKNFPIAGLESGLNARSGCGALMTNQTGSQHQCGYYLHSHRQAQFAR